MAGRGSRLRPHTLTVPKPLIPVAGQPIVHRLVKDIAKILKQPIEEVAFVLGEEAFFGEDVVSSLQNLSKNLGAKCSIYRQLEPLGTGHAIMCAEASLSGPAVVAYADTLIRANFNLDPEADSVIWTKKVDNPEAYGVVKLNGKEEIVEFQNQMQLDEQQLKTCFEQLPQEESEELAPAMAKLETLTEMRDSLILLLNKENRNDTEPRLRLLEKRRQALIYDLKNQVCENE